MTRVSCHSTYKFRSSLFYRDLSVVHLLLGCEPTEVAFRPAKVAQWDRSPPQSSTKWPTISSTTPAALCLLRRLLWLVCLACPALLAKPSAAEEPYQRFLEKLRDEQLFDLALVYLDHQQDKSNLPANFKADLQLERGLLLYQAAAKLPNNNPQRSQKLDEAEVALQQFLNAEKLHPRRGEARMKLGELLLARAEEARIRAGGGTKADIPAEDVSDAIKFYSDAHALFESTIAELSEVLEGMKGARTDASDTAAIAYRQKIQSDIRQSQLLSAKSIEERGRSRAQQSPERKADLETALGMFSDLYMKEQKLVAVRNYALFYRSTIQATLGMTDEAIDGFQRIADQEGFDMLRPLQTDATTELVKLLGSQKKYQPAIDRAEKWLSAARPDELASQAVLNLQLELARLKIEWGLALEAKDPQDRVVGRLKRDTRTALRRMLRTPGTHIEQARQLLAQLGVETEDQPAQELPQVATFTEANTAARERLERSEIESVALESLRLSLADPATSAEQKQELSEQLKQAEQSINRDQQQAIELLHSALRLYQTGDSREDLFEARFRLSFLLLKQQLPWQAMSVAEFLSRSAPGTPQGLRAATVALGSFSDLLRTAAAESKAELTDQLQPFAEYLVATWPESSEASAAASALVQLALMDKNFERAEQFLRLVPSGNAEAAKLRRDAGLMFYSQYLQEKATAGEAAESTVRLRKQAFDLLQSAVTGGANTGVTAAADGSPAATGSVDAGSVEAVSVLARMLLADGQLEAAAKVMFDGDSSPLAALEQANHGLPARAVMEFYRTAVQVKIAQLAEGQLADAQAGEQIRDYIQRLQAAATDAESNEILARIFVGLARDLREQLEATTDQAKRRKMSETLLVVAVEAAKAEGFNTQYWSADTIVSVAEELEKSPASKAQAIAAYGEAAKILEAILAREKSQPGWIGEASMVSQIRLRLAKTSRGVGDYKQAIEQLATVLEENSNLLDIQMEAARTYQAWGDASNSGFHKVAIEGGRPDPKTREKLIWGWGKIQQRTANQPKYTAAFFEARYQLAYSRWQYAKGLSDPARRAEEIQRAARDIESTAKLFPELGGPLMKKRFDSLLKAIQKSGS